MSEIDLRLALYRKHRRAIVGVFAAISLIVAAVLFYQIGTRPIGRPIRIGFDENPPVHFSDANGSVRGYAVDIFNEAARRQGITLEWVLAPEHADRALASDRVDLWPIIGMVPEREKAIYFSEPWKSFRFALFSRKNHPMIFGHTPLALTIAIGGFNIEKYVVLRNFPTATLLTRKSYAEALEAVCTGEADAVLSWETFDEAQSRPKCQSVPLEVSSLPYTDISFAIGAKRGSRDAVRAADNLRSELTRMDNDGTLQSLVFRWSYRDGADISAFFNLLSSRWHARLLIVITCFLAIILGVLVLLALRLNESRRALRQEMADRERAEDQLRESQKMEAIGRLAGGVAHDFNNILGIIMGQSELIQILLDPANPIHKRAGQITEAAMRGSALTQQLLTYSRKQMLKTEIFKVNTVFGGMAELLQRVIGEDINLQMRFRADTGCINSDRCRIEQILLNLAINSRDAMPNGGTLILETANLDLDESDCKQYPEATPGSYVRFCVKDTGCGMGPEVLDRIFEPFFTTKEKGKGTGLGLATVYGIVKQSGGFIGVESRLGHGTTFEILIPRVAEPNDHKQDMQEVAKEPARARGSETVLVVEDEEQLLRLTAEALEGLGYRVLTAADGYRAIQVAESCEWNIDLLLTDVIMPGMGGLELSKVLRKICPSVKVLFISGYTDGALGKQGILESDTFLLEKPFKTVELAGRVRQLLDVDDPHHFPPESETTP